MLGKGETEPMAIVGMGCRWSGGIRDVTGLWEFLLNKRSGYQDWSEPRFSAEGFYHPNPDRPGTTASKGGYVLTEDPRLFDPAFFGISGLEAETIDASQRKLLEVIYEAFESAGDTWESVNGTRTGVYVADISYDNSYAQTRDWEYARPHATTGVCHNILSNRINYVFNLRGPSVTLDSACTSALYGLHMAIQAIRNGDCDSAIVATANWIMDPAMQIAMDKLGALSATSMSHAFDASADGYARGEGFAAIYLKKPEKAMQDGSPIRAIVRGSAIGANGRSSGITHPSGTAQEDIIRKAYENAGSLSPSETPFLECHGTGTRVGDPLEVEAAGNVFGPGRSHEDRLLIGSVKTNLGHTEGAAALAGIFKAVLAIEKGMIPPSIGIKTLNPRINFEKAKAEVVTEVIPWPEGKLRRASVTSAGFGGSIGHCILDHVNILYPGYVKPGIVDKYSLPTGGLFQNGNGIAAHTNGANGHGTAAYSNSLNGNGHTVNGRPHHPKEEERNGLKTAKQHVPILSTPSKQRTVAAGTRELVLLPFSAHNETSLRTNINVLSQVLDQQSMGDIAYTLADRRSKLRERTFRIVESGKAGETLKSDIQRVFSSPPSTVNLGFVFTGQGAQWHAMGSQLLSEYHIFRTAVEHLDWVLSTLPEAPSWNLVNIISGDCEQNFVQTPAISQTICTAVQIGLVDLLASWSVRPSGVLGHSSGEMAAAYAGGYMTAAESITAAYFRGQVVSRNKRTGVMIAVGLGLEEISPYLSGLEQDIKIAAINSPSSLTLSGEKASVEGLSATLNKDGVFNRILQTGGNAYHSHHMVALGHEYETELSAGLDHLEKLGLRNQRYQYPRISWASSVTPNKSMAAEGIAPAYWRANLESPVRFSDSVAALLGQNDLEIGALVEIGPHPALKSPLNQTLEALGKKSIQYAGSLKRGEDGRRSLLQLAGTLFGLNALIDLSAINATDVYDGQNWALAHGVTAIDLPPYMYTYGPISYYESRASKEFRLRSIPRHDLIGSKLAGVANLRPQFRNVIRTKDLPWLSDHRLLPDVVFPAAGYIAMATCAASQIHGEFADALPITGYSLRNINIKSAMKIPEDQHGIEIILSMELADKATARAPAWTSFSVSSVARDSTQWTEHCTGLVKIDVAEPVEPSKISMNESETRPIDTQDWYRTFTAIGLGYGPAFQALSKIRAAPPKNLASAKLALKTTANTVKGGESSYAIHPSSLDAMIQLGLLACHGGQTERATTAFVPIHLSKLYLRSGIDQDWSFAVAHGEFKGLRSAYLQLQLHNQAGDVLLDIEDLRCVRYSLKDNPSNKARDNGFASPFTRMIYKPDFRSLSNRQARALFPPPAQNVAVMPVLDRLEALASLIALEFHESLTSSANGVLHVSSTMEKYLAWIKRLIEGSSSSILIESSKLTSQGRNEALKALYREIGTHVETKALKRLHENIENILHDRYEGEDILAKGGLLSDFFDNSLFRTGTHPQLATLFDAIAHATPNLSILELKGGRGIAARQILGELSDSNCLKKYRKYTVTDASEAALKTAKGQLAGHNDVQFAVLDMEEDPLHQGFQPDYDVVVASQAVHASSSITHALANIKKLLKPNGKLVLVEATGNSAWMGLVGGAQTGYWHGECDGRTDSPFLDVHKWDIALRSAGFSGVDLALDDYPAPSTQSNILVSTLVGRSVDAGNASGIHLLHGHKGAPVLLERLAEALERRGLKTMTVPIDDAIGQVPADARVIAFLQDENLLINADRYRLDLFKHLAYSTASMMWLTSTGMAQGRNPNGAVVGGLLRTISTEAPTARFVSVDVDAEEFDIPDESDMAELIRVLVEQEQILQVPSDGEGSEDREFAWYDGCLRVSRLIPEPLLQNYAEQKATPATHGTELLPLDSQGVVRAAYEVPGILTSLYFCPYPELRQQPLAPDWVEIKVAAVGLNWKDLALATGRFDGNNLSSEYAGIVTQVGKNAADRFAIGDRVFGLGRGHFSNYARVPAGFAQKASSQDNLVDVASMPVVFMTAVYAFEHLSRLRLGTKVLIQSASGGVGLGAIMLARAKGADIYAMVGSTDKARFLIDTVGLPSWRVFAVRNPSEMARAMATACEAGHGFDVILSTAYGEMLHETMKALAPLGRLIDIGRADVNDASAVGLELFQKSATFSSFDLAQVVDKDPELGAQLIRTVDEHYRAGLIGPIRPIATSDISRLDQTLHAFSKGAHVGKLVVSFQNAESLVRMVPAAPKVSFDPKACYVITGGLSGLGRSIIQWMGDRGARYLAVLSRRGGSAPEAQSLVAAMAERGVRVRAFACDLANQEQVSRAIEQASVMCPIKGVIHCAVSYQDISFARVSVDGWCDGLAAKVLGTQHLHEATKVLALDFFVMTTSILSVLSFATQGAYTAANNFQDQFARYRRRLGLPATAAQFGLVNDVGHLSTDTTALDLMMRNKVLTVPEAYFLRLLEPAFLGHSSNTSDPLAAATYVTYMDPAHMAAKEREDMERGISTATSPRWHHDARVSHVVRGYSDALKHEGANREGSAGGSDGESATARLRSEFDESVQRTRAAPAGSGQTKARAETVELATGAIVATVATMLLIDMAGVSAAHSVSEYGVDSLISAELRNWFHLALGSKVSMVDLLDSRMNISALATKVVNGALSEY